MSALDNHSPNRLPRLARIGIATALATSAFALPLLGAVSAQADQAPAGQPQQQSSAPARTTSTDAITVTDTSKAAPAAPAAASTYKVVSGDSLSKIAAARNVDGGWHKLYDDNRKVVGANPNLIFPGQQLSLDAKAAAAPAAQAPAAPAPVAPAPVAKAPAAKPAQPSKPAAAAQAPVTTTVLSLTNASANSSGFTAPVANPHITEAYGVPGTMWASGHHTGVDFAASVGTSLKAVGNGTVVTAGNGGAYGNQVVIKLADGKYAQYAHLSSISVSAGQTVTVGQQIGLSGATGNVTGPHLHFEIRTTPNYGSDIDPIAYLRAHAVNV